MTTNQDFAAAANSNVELLLALSMKAFEAAEKLAALNLQVAKDGLAHAAQASQAALSAKDAEAVLAAQAGWVQPAAGKANEYATAVASIMSGTKAELDHILSAAAGDAKGAFAGMVEAALKNAPQGSGQAVALWKSAVKGATDGFESLQNAAKQASETAQANFATAQANYAAALSGTGTVAKAPKARR
jgi:phasin family protein